MTHTNLCVSLYGKTEERFVELTVTDADMFQKFNKKLKQMSDAGIKYNIERRDEGYTFDIHGQAPDIDFNPEQKCKFHHIPKVLADGSVTFCRTAWSGNQISIGSLRDRSLKDLLTDPIRYKFMDSQSICEHACTSYTIGCNTKQTFAAMKLMSGSKTRYSSDKLSTDLRYEELENAVIQRTK
jgi:hypothetical protein